LAVRVTIGTDDQPAAWRYELHFSQDTQKRPIIKSERVLKQGNEVFVRPDGSDKSDPARLSQTYLEQVHANQQFRGIADFFASVQYLHIVPQLIREPERSVGKSNDPYGGDFLEQIAQCQERTRNAWLRRITDALRVAVPQLKELELWRDVRGTPHLRGKYEHWRPQGAWQTEEQFSDGTLRLMGLLWIALAGKGPLLLEEPELSLHPEVVRCIPQMFARVQRRSGRQVMTSTHSPDLLRDNGISLDEVLLLQPGKEGTSIRSANQYKDIRSLLEGGLPLNEAVIPRTAPARVEQLTLFEK
jgi:predicted ATPase